MKVVKKLLRPFDGGYNIMCPFCNIAHSLDNRWTVSGDINKTPTIKPSIQTDKCHFSVTNGIIKDHNNTGKIVKLIKF